MGDDDEDKESWKSLTRGGTVERIHWEYFDDKELEEWPLIDEFEQSE